VLLPGIALVLTAHFVGGAQTRVEEHWQINHNIRCTIQVQDREWTPAAPAIVGGKVENLTEGSLEINVQPILYLSSKTSVAERDNRGGSWVLGLGWASDLGPQTSGLTPNTSGLRPQPCCHTAYLNFSLYSFVLRSCPAKT